MLRLSQIMVVQYAINMIENIDRITLDLNKRDGLGRNLCNKTLLYSFRFKFPFYHLCEVRDKYCQQYWWHNIETCYHQFCKSNTHVQITRIYMYEVYNNQRKEAIFRFISAVAACGFYSFINFEQPEKQFLRPLLQKICKQGARS